MKLPALRIKGLLASLFEPSRPARVRSRRRLAVECLEDRTLLSVTVTPDTSNLLADATGIVINGSGFDPIVANNSVVFDDGAVGIVTAATATSLVVEFTTGPAAAGNLSAVVTSHAGSSRAA